MDYGLRRDNKRPNKKHTEPDIQTVRKYTLIESIQILAMNGHPNILFYGYSLFKKFSEAYAKVRDDLYQQEKIMLSTCARAAHHADEKQFADFIKGK